MILAPVIFLDFDGVLNNTPWLTNPKKRALDASDSGDASPEARWQRDLRDFDPVNMRALNDLLSKAPEAVVVVSSSWRHGMTVESLQRFLGDLGAPLARVVDKTPRLPYTEENGWASPSRGSEILQWLDANGGKDARAFVVLDDDSDMDGVRDHFVKTDRREGLTEWDVRAALRVLERPVAP